MGARTIVDCGANTEGEFLRTLLLSSGPSDEAADRWGTGAAKRGARLMRRSATCAAGLAASCPALRSGSPVPERSVLRCATENQLTLSSVVRITLTQRPRKAGHVPESVSSVSMLAFVFTMTTAAPVDLSPSATAVER